MLDQHLKKFSFGKINLDAPYLTEWINGILSIQQWMIDEALELPDGSVLRNQLKAHTFEDREESRRGPFYAVDALRCVIGSFELPASRQWVEKKRGWAY